MKTLFKLSFGVGFLMLVMSCSKNEMPVAEGAAVNTSALPHTKRYSGDVANTWFRLLTDVSRTAPLVPPASIRLFVYSELALYEAVVPGMPSYNSIYAHLSSNHITFDKKKDYHWPAAANAAVARVSSRIMKNYNANPNLSAIVALEKKYEDEFAEQASAEDMERSINFGRMVGDLIYDWSTTDGTLTPAGNLAPCPPYVPVVGPGNWEPTPPAFLPAAGACQGKLRTFNPDVQVSTRPAPPPTYSTDPNSEYFMMIKDVVDRSSARTPDQAILCQSWRDLVGTNYNTPAHVLNITTFILEKEGFNLEQVAILYAKQGIATFDAVVSAFDGKFFYALQRPISYIRGVMGNNSWNPLYATIIHPSYPATMPGAASAGFRILEFALGENYSFSDNSLSNLYGSRNYSSFDAIINDVGRTRLLSGHNFQPAIDAGILQGEAIANFTEVLPFKK